ncbi:hypothetical protein [Desertibacillus haloalkaliphilus]|uniref:hypothetical protein n=1 Tax=Desertibacillus haloalkaliphilus TaxID=1328930 RepID=UPI001C2569EC|nr:hypothetical protein [Desertibacillus haloalkaliphilus]MBU8906812.1 hypothetical protein [Desertibacillus haloalkaliphilus]
MYYSKEELERMRKEGEERAEKLDLGRERQNQKYRAKHGDQILCVQCKHDRFEKGDALLNTRGMTFFDLDWLNESSTTLMCNRCGYLHWYGMEVTRIEE